jgi:putative two-component system response regulator
VKSEQKKILYATPMHDVGKIGIPDSILLKPGRLDDQEMEIMKRHTLIGADIIGENGSELLTLAHQVALYHHERWDGTGYPTGLKGEDIPIESRIAAICDVFDAVTSSRPYKKAWSVEDATKLIKQGAGTQFDPRLAGLFIELIPQVVVIKDELPDQKIDDHILLV